MNLDAIEQRARAAAQGPWDAEKTADCIRITRDDVPGLVARVRELEDTLRALRALHTKVDGGVFVDKCSCKGSWPCPTAELLEEA